MPAVPDLEPPVQVQVPAHPAGVSCAAQPSQTNSMQAEAEPLNAPVLALSS
jgi:hypothetical protein